MKRRIMLIAFLLILVSQSASAQWLQWGGPDRNFRVPSGSLSTSWPEHGPQEVWTREFGDGFSSILFEDGRLYSAHRKDEGDVVACLDAETGRTIWETSYDSPSKPDMILDFGPGPISTPVIAGDRIFMVSSVVRLHAFDKTTGTVLWSKDLMEEMGASHLGRGYGPSPLVYKNLLILNVGGKGAGVVAFDQATGEVVWKATDFPAVYSSPIVVNVSGQDQLIVAMGNHRAGLDPLTGEVQWHLELPKAVGVMMATQDWGPDNLLFGSSAYGEGSRAIQVHKTADGYEAKELWYNRKMRVMFAPFVRIGDFVFGSSGDFGPVFLMGLNVKTGDVAWRERGFNRTHFLYADGKLVLLDEEGDLAIATATPEGLTVHARAPVIGRTAWTPPTLIGTRLYIRNRSHMKALELGLSQTAKGGE